MILNAAAPMQHVIYFKMVKFIHTVANIQGRRPHRATNFFGISEAESFINKNMYFSSLLIIFTHCKSKMMHITLY
jgi:hypothetical protein